MPQAVPKSLEISNELIDCLRTKCTLTELRFYSYLREIDKLRDDSDKHFLKALANGAYGRKEEAVRLFEASLRLEVDPLVVQNYIAYLSDYTSYLEYVNAVRRFAPSFLSKTLFGYAWEAHLFSGDLEQAENYAEKLIKFSEPEEAKIMKMSSAEILAGAEAFKKNADLSDSQYKDIANRMLRVIDEHKVKPQVLGFHIIPEEDTNSCFMMVDTAEAEALSDMNLAIAFSLAENDGLLGKHFSVWFEGSDTSASQ